MNITAQGVPEKKEQVLNSVANGFSDTNEKSGDKKVISGGNWSKNWRDIESCWMI